MGDYDDTLSNLHVFKIVISNVIKICFLLKMPICPADYKDSFFNIHSAISLSTPESTFPGILYSFLYSLTVP